MDDIDRKDVLFGIYQRGLENAPWLKDIPSDEKDAMAKKVAGQVDSWLTSKSTHPYQRGRTSITGFGLKLRKIMKTGRLVGVAVSRLVRFLIL